MTIQQTIEKAIEGGWHPGTKTYPWERALLDPSFWSSLGKALEKDSVEVELCGKKVLMDRIFLSVLSYRSWEITPKGYLRGSDKEGKKVFLHRIIKDAQTGEFIDHINGNKLDNRAANLRIVTLKENALNKRKTKLGEYRGVSWHKQKKRWVAQVRFQRKSYYGGYFQDKDDAARAAEALRKKLFTQYHDGVTREWWIESWHRFIDHLAEGKKPEEFFENL